MPGGFKPNWVILLEDPVHGHSIEWHEHELPFTGVTTEIVVPAGGVVRVASLGRLAGNGEVRATWNDGRTMVGMVAGAAPPAANATGFVAYEREHGLGYDPRDDLPTEDPARFAAYLAAHER